MNADQGKSSRAMKATAVPPALDFDFQIPDGRESFRIFEVAKLLSHSQDQIMNLMDAGKFGKVINCGNGRKSSATITRAGLVKFLRENSQ